MFNSIFQVVDDNGTFEELRMETSSQVKTVKVVSSKRKKNGIRLPVKALRRSIRGYQLAPWYKSLTNHIQMAWTWHTTGYGTVFFLFLSNLI